MIYKGKVWCLGNDVDTDMIISGQYLSSNDAEFLSTHCFEAVEQGWISKISPGDIIVAGKNFGCGSSREHAPIAIKASGISCILAESYGAIFLRNSINIGLPAIELKDAGKKFKEGDAAEIDISTGKARNLTEGKNYDLLPTASIFVDILEAGGLLKYIKKKVDKNKYIENDQYL